MMSADRMVEAWVVKEWLDNDEAVLIDVREPGEYALEHIPGSIHLPLAQVTTRLLPIIGTKKIVVHCQLGKRGSMACVKLSIENPELQVYNLEGGLSAWKEAGFPTSKS